MSGNYYTHIQIIDKYFATFTVTMDQNSTVEPRFAVVRVMNNCTNEYKDFLFSQLAANIGVSPDPTKPNVSGEGENRGPFTAQANSDVCPKPGTWAVTANQDWCTVIYDPSTGGFSLQFDPNPSVEPRDVVITVTNDACDIQAKYTITQDGNPVGLKTNNTFPDIPAEGGETGVSTPEGKPSCTTAKPAYSLSIVKGYEYAHLIITSPATGEFKVRFDANPTVYERNACCANRFGSCALRNGNSDAYGIGSGNR
jgi:hypothetical protein